jgi:hypothetical protein
VVVAGREAAVRAWWALLVALVLASCAEPERSDAPVMVLVLVDGVEDERTAQEWRRAMNVVQAQQESWSHGAGAVSTSTVATLASVLTGEEPSVHGRFSARDYGVELRTQTLARALVEDGATPFTTVVAACVRRELAPEVVALDDGFDSWITVPGGELGAALSELDSVLTSAYTRTSGTFALAVESMPTVGGARTLPANLAFEIEREVGPLVVARTDVPSFAEPEKWFDRRWLGDAVLGPALERAFAAAHQRAFSERLAALASHFREHHDDWCITVAGLVPPSALIPTTRHARVPIASTGEPTALEAVRELVDLTCAVRRRCGHLDAEPRASQREFGLWTSNAALRGRRVGLVRAAYPWSDHLLEPPLRSLEFSHQWTDRPVHVVVTANEPCLLGDPSGEPLSKIVFDLEPRAQRRIAFDRPSPDLLIEISSDGRALTESDVVVCDQLLAVAPLMRVIDTREVELGAQIREERRVSIERRDDGRLSITGPCATPPLADAWPRPLDPLEVVPDELPRSTWIVRAPSATRLALLVPESESSGGACSFADIAFDGRALTPTALRFLWPPVAKVSSAAPSIGTTPHVRITPTPSMGLAVRVPRELRGLLQSLLPHE